MGTNLFTAAPEMALARRGKIPEEYPMSSNFTSVAPAGWYRDPLGLPQVRWWNGMSWTNRIEEIRPEIQLSQNQRELVAS